MAELTEGQKLTKRYIDIMKDNHACHFVCRDGYIFDNSPAAGRGEFERIMTVMDVRDFKLQLQILRYLAWVSYADMQMIIRLAKMFEATQEIPNVVTNEGHLASLMTTLVKSGAVNRRSYRRYDGAIEKGLFYCYCLSDRGAMLFKDQTYYSEYIEENLVKKGDLEIMKRLAVNYIMTKFAPRMKTCGHEVGYCRSVLSEGEKGIRRVLYGSTESEKAYTVMEPAFYKRDAEAMTEEELEKWYNKRIRFLKENLQTSGENKQKVFVLIIEDSSWLKRAYLDYIDIIDICDQVYVTSEALANSYVSGPSPFLLVSLEKETAKKRMKEAKTTDVRSLGNDLPLKLEAKKEDPPFLRRKGVEK